jgi:hypothetical protein
VRGISRIGTVAALTAAIALGASGTAFANGADDQYVSLTAAVNPNNMAPVGEKPTGVNLLVQPQWLDNDNNPVVPAEGNEETRIDFDDDFVLQTKKLPTCNTDPAVLVTQTTAEAINGCASSQVGSGMAKVRVGAFGGAPFNFENSEADLTVTAFNAPPTVAGPANCNDTNLGGPFNCEWVGDKPQLYLHAYNQRINQISLVRGEIQSPGDTLPGAGTPPIGAGYGQRLAVTDGTDVAGDTGAVTLFNAVVGKKYKYKKGGKTIKANYTAANCDINDDMDPDVAGTQPGLQFKVHTVYDDDQTHSANVTDSQDTDVAFQRCAPLG